MKENELRIGDLVYDRNGKIIRIDWFERDKICMKMEIDGVEVHPLTEYFEYLKPIPLTEKILMEWCGFNINRVTKEDNNIWRKTWTEGYFELEEIISFFFGLPIYSTEIKYLHQLQNLYFALTWEELTIKNTNL